MRRYKHLPPILIVAALLAAVFLNHMRSGRNAHYSETALMMDTMVEVDLWGKGRVPFESAVDSALASIRYVEDLFGKGLVDSRIDSAVMATPAFRELLGLSEGVYETTEGCFDPTIGSVTRLWHFWDGAEPPPRDSISAGLRRVGLEKFLSGDGDGSCLFDLGGIAKGYAVDRAAATVRRLGFKSAIINAGGDLALVGKRPDGRPWRIAVRHPRRADTFLGFLDLENAAVATSGDYERCFIFDGRRYHHILDPRTGLPGKLSNSVTVVSPGASLSDALATGLFLMGPRAGLETVESLQGVEAVFAYDEGGSLAVSSGLRGRFEEVGR